MTVCYGAALSEISCKEWAVYPGEFMSRISFLPDFLSAVTYGSFHVVESALNLHLDLERWSRRKGGGSRGNMRMARRKRGGEKWWIQGDPPWLSWKLQRNSKLLRFLFLLAPCTWAASSHRGYPYLGDPGPRHIYLVRSVLRV